VAYSAAPFSSYGLSLAQLVLLLWFVPTLSVVTVVCMMHLCKRGYTSLRPPIDCQLPVVHSASPAKHADYVGSSVTWGRPRAIASQMALWRKQRYGIPTTDAERIVAAEQMFAWAERCRSRKGDTVTWRKEQITAALPLARVYVEEYLPDERELAEYGMSAVHQTAKLVGWRHTVANLLPPLAHYLATPTRAY